MESLKAGHDVNSIHLEVRSVFEWCMVCTVMNQDIRNERQDGSLKQRFN